MLAIFLFLSSSTGFAYRDVPQNSTIASTVIFSSPMVTQGAAFCEISIPEATGVLQQEGYPQLPVYTTTFEFPLGTILYSVDIMPTEIQTMSLKQPVQPVPVKHYDEDRIVLRDGDCDADVYHRNEVYPSEWSTLTTGAGLNTANQRTFFVNCHLIPVRYQPAAQLLEYCSSFTVTIRYEEPVPQPVNAEDHALVILSPAEFVEQLQPLVDHKTAMGLSTVLVTLDEVYSTSSGRDQAEKIKYFIKEAVENWNTQYVLLVGDMKKLPIRVTYASWWEPNLLSDLYYGDLYNAQGQFCSWDDNANNRFGEINHDGEDLDGVDLYADVHIGRLACRDATEVTTVVDKIITYEEETFNQVWFQRILLAGGDTFPLSYGAPLFVYEGEITNTKVGQTLPEFEQTYLWTSKHTLHASSFNREINTGVGFVSYAGHGFEHGWGTYRPNAISRTPILYYTPWVYQLKNAEKLPVIFFDACLTSKLDFNFTDLYDYYPRVANLLARVFGLSTDPSEFYTCFAWSFLAQQGGGAIATIGSTRTAYTWVDANGVYGGAGYLDVHFFDSYEDGVTVGEMLTGAQNAYITNVGADYFTIEEFILLGDPSLRVGGYP